MEQFFPICAGENAVGVLAVGGLMGDCKPEEQEFLGALLGLAASVISNAQAHDAARSGLTSGSFAAA